MTRATVMCPFDGFELPVDVSFPMTPQGPVLNIDAPELVAHMKIHEGGPMPKVIA